MTLRKRLLWLFAPLLLLSLGFAYLLSQSLILSRFDLQDAKQLEAEAERLRALLDTDLKRHLDLLATHAHWDDSYAFMQGNYPDFPQRSLEPEILRQLNFDFMVYLDPQGRVRAEQWLPPDLPDLLVLSQDRPASHAALRASILNLARRLRIGPDEAPSGQLVTAQGVPLMLAMGNISDNQGNLPSAGTLVAGHFLDSERAERLQAKLDATLRLLPHAREPARGRELPGQEPGSANRIEISPRRLLDDELQQVLLLFRNGLGEPELALELTRDRRLYHEGHKAIAIFLLQAGAIGALSWLLIFLGLEFAILRRVSRMHREIADIGPSSSGWRLSDRGGDELGRLATGINRMLERLDRSEERDREILDAIQDGYFELDPEGRIVAVNRALCEMLGYRPEQLLSRSYETLLEADDLARARARFGQTRSRSGNTSFAAPLRRHDGSQGHYETRVSPILGGQGEFAGYRGILRDIGAQVAYQNQLLDMAYRDPLTGLGNRKAFTEQLRQALQQDDGPLALLFLDLDHFKEVNDRFGHDVGDALLRHIAERLRSAVRQPDLVYRLGGDEFTLILPRGDETTSLKLAERLLSVLGSAIGVGSLSIDFVTPSIGIALYPRHASSVEGLTRAADAAMYEAKRERNRACLYRAEPLSSAP
ncbi:diguanylate cyclase [Pseudomonas sp. CAU 1711]|uniref:sensor domain-containing diguanylate cyclase n=1 Tax=Pseudomonas sp. CAU 1711 TaxID=3140356 RepID=UPI0032608E65